MSKERKAQLITVVILAIAGGVAVARKEAVAPAAAPSSDPTPQDIIYAMLEAAREGNVTRYLAAHTGSMEQSLRKAIAESTEEGFSKYLKQTNAAIKGIALQQPQPLTDREVKVRVEYVFEDRNEVQFMYLEKSGNTWKISRVDNAERIKTLVPYGTPVR